MTPLRAPRPTEGWLIEITIQAAHGDDKTWTQQLDVLRSVATYDRATQTWSTRIGALDARALGKLQALFDAARRFGTQIHIEAAPVPTGWAGPSFGSDGEVDALLTAKADKRRPLGQLPIT
ncbi:hypothetical protein ACFU7X_10705 [Streptomyces chartreusis]|uniref:hypothetical protein n=1 Tax=Streptomyces chartreusis TaxID=1969 RepID=UPI0036AF1DC6